jgi:hypothetical protein
MADETVILINNQITLRQLHNAIKRAGLNPQRSVSEIERRLQDTLLRSGVLELSVGGERFNLYIREKRCSAVKLLYRGNLDREELVIKDFNTPIYLLSLKSSNKAVEMLTRVLYEVGGGYLLPNDLNGKGDLGKFHKIKGKR